jgi:hypothetical protein
MGAVVEPRFIVSLDNGDVDVEPADAPTAVEGYDIEETAAYSLSGERLELRLDNGEPSGPVSVVATGDVALDELLAAVQRYADRGNLPCESTGDLLIDVANAIGGGKWAHRWPKRPSWLSARMHGTKPVHYSRD